ncbi:MAG: hypothetical protein KatS3mg104_3137 [Phycisphaerae bacterium]|nr:MAG: hypothetical protein KatS3mg104_3137 [Phycisphaerae bacterium]
MQVVLFYMFGGLALFGALGVVLSPKHYSGSGAVAASIVGGGRVVFSVICRVSGGSANWSFMSVETLVFDHFRGHADLTKWCAYAANLNRWNVFSRSVLQYCYRGR